MKSDVEGEGFAASLAWRQPLLRIAIPSWRWERAGRDPGEKGPLVSREEILSLFQGELGWRRRRPKLTQREEGEKQLAHSIRQALYPS